MIITAIQKKEEFETDVLNFYESCSSHIEIVNLKYNLIKLGRDLIINIII